MSVEVLLVVAALTILQDAVLNLSVPNETFLWPLTSCVVIGGLTPLLVFPLFRYLDRIEQRRKGQR